MAADAEHRRRLEWLVNVLVGFLVMFILVASLAVAFGFLPGTERTQGYAYNILSSVGAGCAVFLLGKKRRD